MTATLQSYTTGTVAVTNGSDIVTLTGGAWLESWCVPGSDMRIAGESTAMVIEEWIDATHVRLTIPIQRTTAAGLTYSILMTSPAFGTNRLGALTAVERIRLMTENVVINQLLGVATGGLATPALQDRIGIWDASDDMNAKPGTLGAALKAGTSVLTKSVNYAVTVDDYGSLIAMSAGTGARTVTLPAAATAGAGFVIGVKKTDASANAVTIARSSTNTIDGATSLALTVQYGTAILRCDGTDWHVVVLENTSAFARSLLDDANAAAALTTLGLSAIRGTFAPPNFATADLTPADVATLIGGSGFYDFVSLSGTPVQFPAGFPQTFGAIRGYVGVNNLYQYSWQELTGTSGNRKWMRRATSATTWGPWAEVYHTGNIVGTVSMSAGLPGGAAFQRGSTGDGEFVRFADGTQVCWFTASTPSLTTTAWGSTFLSNSTTFSFPAAFSSIPTVAPACRWVGGDAGSVALAFNQAITTTSVVMYAFSGVSTGGTRLGYVAEGRWAA